LFGEDIDDIGKAIKSVRNRILRACPLSILSFGMTLQKVVKSGIHTRSTGPFFLVFQVKDEEPKDITPKGIERGVCYLCGVIEMVKDVGWKVRDIEVEDICESAASEKPRPESEQHASEIPPELNEQDLVARPKYEEDDSSVSIYAAKWVAICRNSTVDSLPRTLFFQRLFELEPPPRIFRPSYMRSLIRVLVDENDEVTRAAFLNFCTACIPYEPTETDNIRVKELSEILNDLGCFMGVSLDGALSYLTVQSRLYHLAPQPTVFWLVRFSYNRPRDIILSFMYSADLVPHHVRLRVIFTDDRKYRFLYGEGEYELTKSWFEWVLKTLYHNAEVSLSLCPMSDLEPLTVVPDEDIRQWEAREQARREQYIQAEALPQGEDDDAMGDAMG